MKNLKKLCAAGVLTLALALPALAGEMGAGVIAPPPSDSSLATTQGNMGAGVTGNMETTVTGDMHAGITATDSATGVVLSLVQGLMSLF